jgi:hypothetical protein
MLTEPHVHLGREHMRAIAIRYACWLVPLTILLLGIGYARLQPGADPMLSVGFTVISIVMGIMLILLLVEAARYKAPEPFIDILPQPRRKMRLKEYLEGPPHRRR